MKFHTVVDHFKVVVAEKKVNENSQLVRSEGTLKREVNSAFKI